MKNGLEYIESLRSLKPVIYCNGERIESVVDHPMTRPHVNAAAMTYAFAFGPYKDLATATSHLTGKKVNRFTHIHQSTSDLINKVKLLRKISHKTGTCFQRCVGMDALNATFIVTHKIDKELGTGYHQRFIEYLKYVQENDLMIAGSMTDVKGDRSLKPSQQADPDMYVHIVEKNSDGIVIRGAKAHQTGMANSHEMLILPTANLGPEDRDYAVAAAVPVDAPGVIHIFGRQTNDQRRLQGNIDTGNAKFAIVGGETLTILNDVFVPWERVFMCGEYQYAQEYVEKFAAYHRQNYGGCKVGLADVIIGASQAMAEYNGVAKASHIKDKIIEMINLAETMYCCSIACSAEGKPTEAGSYYVDTLLANTVKLNCTRNMYEISRLAHDIAGGFIATLPYEADYKSPVTGPYIEKYLKGRADIPTEDRIRMARLIENMTGGTALAESMHGAGSPQAMRIMLYREANIQEKAQFAKNLAGIKPLGVETQVAATKEDKE
ncbi:MAG: 4-hydroxybutyryl-CoA dehydratase [Clostridia bacterium]|nr:4-hydroxybutyryl-CoA dehydratase [Clostridia bacterium]